jgi:serine/threonine protein kinase
MSTSSSSQTKPSTGSSESLDVVLKDLGSCMGSFDSDLIESIKNLANETYGRPALPYTVGATFTTHRHEPPAPFGHGYDAWRPFKTGHFRLPQLNYCLIQQPIEGRTLEESYTLTITETIRTGYIYGAQVVLVNGDIVAKIYDPLYDDEYDPYQNKRDVVALSDGDYSRETAAYDELRRDPKAQRFIPEYYGSWTIDVPTMVDGQTYTRHVRLILIEHITGTVMTDIQQPHLLPKHTRYAIMQKVLEAEALIFDAGVLHRDIAPRNVMLVSPSPTSSLNDPEVRVVIIDFNVSNVLRLCTPVSAELKLASIQQQWPGRILSPVLRFWNGMENFAFKGWVNSRAAATNEWLWACFGKRDEYVPLVRSWGVRAACPRVDWCGESRGEIEDG